MARVIFYEKPGCRGNADQQALLLAAGHEVVARNLLAEPWTADALRMFFAGLPVAACFNRASPRVKSGEIVPESFGEFEALAALLADPLLIRRPLLQVGDERRVGFDRSEIERWIGLGAAATGSGNLEACRRAGDGPCPTP